MSESPSIPDVVGDLLTEEELAEMRAFEGWRYGHAALLENGEVTERVQGMWIELCEGFDGVRLMGVDEDGELREMYAHASREKLEAEGTEPAWFVTEFAYAAVL